MVASNQSDKQPIAAKSEVYARQHVAIVYADVANYSGLCALDEDGTHRQLEEYLNKFTDSVKTHGGYVHHYAGDAVLATFEKTQPAMECCIELQKELGSLNASISPGRRVEFRIGVNQGSVIPDRGDVYGEDVNITARLQALSTPGGICISDRVRSAIDENKLDVTITYLGERSLKNLPGRVSAYLVEIIVADDSDGNRLRSRTGAWLQLPRRPSLAVLPFACLDGDAAAIQFADGLSMEVMTELVKLSGLFLASDFSTLKYRSEQPSAEAVFRELGVRYVLTGTVRGSGDMLRINAQLVDAKDGEKIWAERYQENIANSFIIQDAITESIISALDIQLLSGERSRITRKLIRNREALNRYYRGWSLLVSGTREDLIMAQNAFEEAAELEPESPMPLAMASWTNWWLGFRMPGADSKDAFARAESFAIRAQKLEDPSGFSSLVMANIHLMHRDHKRALKASRYALELRPSCDVSAATYASVLNYLDKSEEAIQYAEQAIRLTPIAPTIYPAILASCLYGAGRYLEAVTTAHAVIEHNSDALDAWLVLAVAETALNNGSAARAAVKEALTVKPNLKLKDYLDSQPYVKQRQLDDLAARLRTAGLD